MEPRLIAPSASRTGQADSNTRPPLSNKEVEEEERRIIGRGDEVVLIRLDPDVLERLKAEGPGWQQTRANAILRKALGMD